MLFPSRLHPTAASRHVYRRVDTWRRYTDQRLRSTPVTVPAEGPVSLEVYPVATIEATPPAQPISSATFDDMVRALSHRGRVLGLGEANHGTADFYALRGALSLALARVGGLRLALIEADAVGLLQ